MSSYASLKMPASSGRVLFPKWPPLPFIKHNAISQRPSVQMRGLSTNFGMTKKLKRLGFFQFGNHSGLEIQHGTCPQFRKTKKHISGAR